MARTADKTDIPRRLTEAGNQLFTRCGYHATGIAELCEVNGLGKGAFYHYIKSKEELLAAIHDRVMDEEAVAERVRLVLGRVARMIANR